LGLAACGGEGEEGVRPTIVATTGVVADIAEGVAGPDAEVVQLIPDGASPHDYALTAKDRLALEEADLVVANGGGLEAGIPLDGIAAPVWALTDHAGPLLTAAADGHGREEEGEADEHGEEQGEDDHEGEGSKDPHVWMDPARTARAIPSLVEALAEADLEHATAYEERGRDLAGQLRALDRDLASRLEAVPARSRLLVTNHDALGYFADRYEFEVVATAFPAAGPEAEASAHDLAELAATVRATGIPAVFAEQSENPAALRRVAEEVGAEVVAGLYVESPADAGSYEEMLRRDAELVAAALR
jgi:ABC-type Zn uptake system ZnuABC Zn-binding protein ZnuA